MIKVKRDNIRTQKLIRNNLIYEYHHKIKDEIIRHRRRKDISTLTNCSAEIDWQKHIESWDMPDLVYEFKLKTGNVNGAYLSLLLELSKFKKELSKL